MTQRGGSGCGYFEDSFLDDFKPRLSGGGHMPPEHICKNDEKFVIFVALFRSDSGPGLRGVFDENFVEFA